MHAFAFIEVGLYSRPNSQAFSTHIREGERLAPMSRSPLPRIREFKGGNKVHASLCSYSSSIAVYKIV